jgi:hypothetical protein
MTARLPYIDTAAQTGLHSAHLRNRCDMIYNISKQIVSDQNFFKDDLSVPLIFRCRHPVIRNHTLP